MTKVKEDLVTLIKKHPRLIGILHEAGIHFCAGCYLTLSATPGKAAAYHGVPNAEEFVRKVERVVGSAQHPPRRHSRRR